jgi:hypothetical protein
MNICISFLKKTFLNHTDNGSAEPQDKFLYFEKDLNLVQTRHWRVDPEVRTS